MLTPWSGWGAGSGFQGDRKIHLQLLETRAI